MSGRQTIEARLVVIKGPMFAGKTTTLMRHLESHQQAGMSVMAISHVTDARYHGSQHHLVTHDQTRFPALKVARLADVLQHPEYHQTKVVGIDEAQFFPDLADNVRDMLSHGKSVFVAGLSGTFAQKPFGQLFEIEPLADQIEVLYAVCFECRADAPFTVRRDLSCHEIIVPGSSDLYRAVCRQHMPPTQLS